MDTDTQDLSLKFRMTGALVWLLLLVIVVPAWYSHPINFSPDMEKSGAGEQTDQVVVDKPFLLPGAAKDFAKTASISDDKTEINKSEPKLADNAENKPQKLADATQKTTVSKPKIEASAKKSEALKKPKSNESSDVSDKWIIRVAAYRSKEKANLLREHLKYDYDVFVKYFPKSRYYSVRIGPYTDKQLAMKDQLDLNRVLRIHSVLAKVN